MIKRSIQEEDITIVNINAPNIKAPQYTRQTITDIKGEIDSNTIIVGDFNTLGGSDGKSICLQCRRPGFNPWVTKIPLEKEIASHSSTLAWKIPGRDGGAWWATVHGVAKSWTRLSNFTLTFTFTNVS